MKKLFLLMALMSFMSISFAVNDEPIKKIIKKESADNGVEIFSEAIKAEKAINTIRAGEDQVIVKIAAGKEKHRISKPITPKVKYQVLFSQESGNNHFTILVMDAKGNKFWMSDTIFHLIDEGVDINEVVIMSQL